MSEEDEQIQAIHKTLISFNKRAERSSEAVLVASFVDSAPLLDLLSTPNNQVIYGRRGTGKTHALKFLSERVESRGEHPIYLDLRSIGSNSSIYADGGRPLTERASTLLLDVLGGLYDEIYRLTLDQIDRHPNPGELTRRLDVLQGVLSSVVVSGDTQIEVTESASDKATRSVGASGTVSSKPNLSLFAKSETEAQHDNKARLTKTGREVVHLTFGNISAAISNLLSMLSANRLWLLIDEWSETPVDLQPYLADLLRRTLLPINNISIKIAAIEHRSSFAILKSHGEYIGLELGADISADLNLDDFLVFDNDQSKATQFVETLLFNHYSSSEDRGPNFSNSNQLIGATFTQYPAFEEFVRPLLKNGWVTQRERPAGRSDLSIPLFD